MTKLVNNKITKKYTRLALRVVSIILVILFITTFIFGVKIHYGNNMFPAIRDGDLYITYKLGKNYNKDEIVQYKANGTTHIGRIVGMPGDEINIKPNGNILINGMTPSGTIFYKTEVDKEIKASIPKDGLFVLNDYREDRDDSRKYSSIYNSGIQGKIIFLVRRRGF